ncbi:MAG: glycerol-3-phosphate 1-O-acyltransferase PlsY [Candidatus Saganbacteria bacterium]|nr:glycerol-3-phosphate 1-O-acyltransferase PlsY [Candidatus Saganbacteria bacterium]
MPIFAILASYILGSIPFGFIAGKIFNLDIRQHGSGNIGATNVLRTLGPVPGSIVFFLDFLKGCGAVYLGMTLTSDPLIIILCGVSALIGHSYPIFLNFKGGKGVATGFGVLFGIAPIPAIIAISFALLIMAITKYVSLGSLTGTATAIVLLFSMQAPLPYQIVCLIGGTLIFIRHSSNIKQLIAGTEKKLGQKQP